MKKNPKSCCLVFLYVYDDKYHHKWIHTTSTQVNVLSLQDNSQFKTNSHLLPKPPVLLPFPKSYPHLLTWLFIQLGVKRIKTKRSTTYFCSKKSYQPGGFPGGPVVKNLPSSAGDASLIPGQGTKIPHAVGQLSPCAITTEPVCSGVHMPQLEPMCHKKRS